jgi:Tol biopolymer transport system component
MTLRYCFRIALLLSTSALASCGGGDSTAPPPPPPTTGTLEFNIVTTGVDIDADGFMLALDGHSQIIPANGTSSISVLPGRHAWSVNDPAFNCDVTTQQGFADVTLAATTRVDVLASCTPYLSNVIVYVSREFGDDEVMVMRPDGSRRQRLTIDPFGYGAPVVSPDGQSIVVASSNPGVLGVALYFLGRFGGGRTQLVARSTSDVAPAWSPDGTKIAFRSNAPNTSGPTSRIFIINRDGTGLRQLSPESTDPNLFVSDGNPSWSPDGTRLVLSRSGVLHIVNADGTGLVSTGVAGDSPSWSPDGTQIAFETLSGGTDGLFVMDMSFTPRRLTPPGEGDQMPRWSPDGSQLVFARVEAGVFHIFKVGADGSNVTKLSTVPQSNVFPSWSRNF